jgi:porin
VISGGKNIGWEYTGRGNLTLNIDTQKLGLWPGGFFTIEVEGNYNKPINLDTGAIMPVNANQLFPTPGKQELNIPAVSFAQFLSHYFGVLLGKLDTTSGLEFNNPFGGLVKVSPKAFEFIGNYIHQLPQ